MSKNDVGASEPAPEGEPDQGARRGLASDAFNRTLLASLPQKLFYKDRSSVYVAVNEPYARSLGVEARDVVGKDDFAFFPPELAEKYRADDRAVMESGQGRDFDERYVAQGAESWIRTTKAPVRNDAGEVTGVLGPGSRRFSWSTTKRRCARSPRGRSKRPATRC